MLNFYKTVGMGVAGLGMAMAAQASLISNGDFSDGLNDWQISPIGGGVSVVEIDGGNAVMLSDPDSVGVEWIYQNFYVPEGVDQLEISFNYRFDSINNSLLFHDTAGGQLFTLGTGLGDWVLGNELFRVTEDSNGWVSFTGVYDVSGIWDYNPNARIGFGISETWAGLWWDSTDSALYLSNIQVGEYGGAVAVPEPGSLALLGLGLMALGLGRRSLA